jgi:suppressor for copper-sensitivity B
MVDERSTSSPLRKLARLSRWLAAVVLVVAASIAPTGASERVAGASAWAMTEHGAVRLISAVEGVGDGATVPIALEFQMNPGWHIYWRSPGDAGYAPKADWSGSVNLAAADLSWPAPRRFSVLDLQTVGYEGAVVLPIDARLLRAGEPVALRATVDYLTCAEICVPYVAELALDLPEGGGRPSAFSHEIARARALVPSEGAVSGLSVEQVSFRQSTNGPSLIIALRSQIPLVAPDVFVEAASPLVFGAPNVSMADDRRSAVVTVAVFNTEGLAHPLEGLPVTVTVVDGQRALEEAATVHASAAETARLRTQSAVAAAPAGFLTIVAMGLLGGLLLNLMPCVLPVLSLKLLAVVGHGGGRSSDVRAGFVAAGAGIFSAFMVLAGTVVILKATGHAIGWGLQFQQPWFLTAMILVVTLFACNLWGFFEVPLPRVLSAANERAGRVHGLAGHFVTGSLATLLATPCSAPFLGTAIGFALSAGALEIVAVFAAVALGLATPYLVVAAFPSLATRLPKPGRWMLVLRRLLGLALAGTALWLVWVLAGRIGWAGALAVGGVSAVLAIVLAGRSVVPPRLRPVCAAGLAALVSAAFLVPVNPPADARAGPWRPFEPHLIPALVAEGHTVFVNVTADWCLTCKVNERLVLARDPVRTRLREPHVVAMQGDWTVPDESIGRYLAGFRRYGIPFDAVYGPATPQGEALPELLDDDAVLRALSRADGRTGTP